MKGGFGCSPCCGPTCEQCTRTCTEPHTGDPFEVVFTRFFEGVEVGNPTDGYLTATGDSDTSDPYDGMDGSGPWFQQITGGFTLNSTQTRFPCRVLVSFWRNNYTLGAATIPPASTALTSNKIYVTVSAGAVIVGDRIIVPADGEVHIDGLSIPLVTGGGDQSGNIPRFYEGSVSVAPQCESASFSIRARIEWNTQKRQHVLYGLVRECYEEGTPCATFCSGSAPPDTIYVTISNYTGPSAEAYNGSEVFNGTYVLDRVPNTCSFYRGSWASGCLNCSGASNPLAACIGVNGIVAYAEGTTALRVGFWKWADFSSACRTIGLGISKAATNPFCGSGVIASGTDGVVVMDMLLPWTAGDEVSGSFDWEIEA